MDRQYSSCFAVRQQVRVLTNHNSCRKRKPRWEIHLLLNTDVGKEKKRKDISQEMKALQNDKQLWKALLLCLKHSPGDEWAHLESETNRRLLPSSFGPLQISELFGFLNVSCLGCCWGRICVFDTGLVAGRTYLQVQPAETPSFRAGWQLVLHVRLKRKAVGILFFFCKK